VTMIAAALVIDAIFGVLGLVPTARPSADDVFGSIGLDYKLVLNVLALGGFVALVALTRRRGAVDPVCGMTVDRAKAVTLDEDGRTVYFCSEHCRHAYAAGDRDPARARAHSHAH
jgi:YHS domain-containing protein